MLIDLTYLQLLPFFSTKSTREERPLVMCLIRLVAIISLFLWGFFNDVEGGKAFTMVTSRNITKITVKKDKRRYENYN